MSLFTATSLFVQEPVASGALALEADWPVHAYMGAAAVVDHTLIQPWETNQRRQTWSNAANHR